MKYSEPNFEIFIINNEYVICSSPNTGLELNEAQEGNDIENMDNLL